ncbi:MAG: FAD-dependent oxidoreductase [Bacteroidota bacterium]
MLLAVPYLSSCSLFDKRQIKLAFIGSDPKVGHLIRQNKFPEPITSKKINTLIVGSGIGGLSAARHLLKNNKTDFLILELDSVIGGNSKAGKNNVSEFPMGAHYLPIPTVNFKELIDFLVESKIITGFNSDGLPIYNEYYLCFEPQERIYFKGIWQDGIPPDNGLNEIEKEELLRFLKITEEFKNAIGTDNKPAFTIPLELSSNDEKYLQLDKISIFDYLKQNNFKSNFILWYLDYCCKDDFGTNIKNTSAWAVFHYFSSRNGKAANAANHELLTWPEGNNFLVKKLSAELNDKIKTQHIVYKVKKIENKTKCYVYDLVKNESIEYECENLILATPQFVNKNIFDFKTNLNFDDFNYYPWIVASITINNKLELNGSQELSWDNVIYGSKSLGYVNACHQNFNSDDKRTVITYYYNFSEESSKIERNKIREKDENYWKSFIIEDLKNAHLKIENLIEEIQIVVWGHGMISPKVGFRSSKSRQILENGFDNIYFANSDVSGISIFEQAFYRGICAAKSVLNNTK